MKKMHAEKNLYDKFQGNLGKVSEKELIERAVKLSL